MSSIAATSSNSAARQPGDNNDILLMSPMNITGFRKRKLESPELSVKQLFKRQQQLMSEHNHIAAKFLDLMN